MMRNIPPIPQGLPPQNAPSNSLVAVPIPSNNNVFTVSNLLVYKTRNLLILIEFSSDLVQVHRSKIIFVRERILFLDVTESIYLIFFWKRIVSFKPRNLNSIPIEGRVFKCILTCISKLSTILLRFVHIWSMFTMTYFGGRKNNRPPGKFSHYLVIRYGYLSNS